MIMKLLAAGALALMLVGCDQASKGFEKGFNEQFAKSTHDSCVKSAVEHGAPADRAEPYCTCFVQQFDKLTAQEKMKLNPSSPELAAAAKVCNP